MRVTRLRIEIKPVSLSVDRPYVSTESNGLTLLLKTELRKKVSD